jgi:hypothetical protein
MNLLLWDLGADAQTAEIARKALRVYCTLVRTGNFRRNDTAHSSKNNADDGSGKFAENVATVLSKVFQFAMWHLVQKDWPEMTEGQQEQSMRSLAGMVSLLRQTDVNKQLPKVCVQYA